MFHIIGAVASLLKNIWSFEQSPYIDLEDYPKTEITDLIIYPWRGVAGIHLEKATLEMSGFKFDREWFLLQKTIKNKDLIRPGRRWVSINRCDKVAQISCKFEDSIDLNTGKQIKYLVFLHPEQDGNDLKIDTTKPATDEIYEVFNFEKQLIKAYSEGDEASKWFTQVIGIEVVLARSFDLNQSSTHDVEMYYRLNKNDVRKSGHTHASIHLINEKSLANLQSKLPDQSLKLTAEQFRPNIVISGVKSDDEDDMREWLLLPQNITLRVVKLCNRWKTPTFNKQLGTLNDSNEPLTTLITYKTHKDIGTIFGTFLQTEQECEIKIGDKIKYTKITREPIVYEKVDEN